MRGGRTSRTGPAADAPTSRDDSTSRHTRTDAIRTADAHAPRSKPRRVGAHPRRRPGRPGRRVRIRALVSAVRIRRRRRLRRVGDFPLKRPDPDRSIRRAALRAPRARGGCEPPRTSPCRTTRAEPTSPPQPSQPQPRRRGATNDDDLNPGGTIAPPCSTAPWATLRRRMDEIEKSNARIAALQRRRGGAVERGEHDGGGGAARVRDPGGTDRRDASEASLGTRTKELRSTTRGSFDENAPPTPPGFEPSTSASSKGLRSSLDDADSRRSSEEFTFSPPPAPAASSLANLSALMSSARSSSSSSMKPFASTPTPNGVSSDGLSDDASIRESAMKVLDSPEAAAAAAQRGASREARGGVGADGVADGVGRRRD